MVEGKKKSMSFKKTWFLATGGRTGAKEASMQHKIYGLLLFIGAPFAAFAQYERLLKNPDIIWAAEMEVTYSLKPPPAVDPFRENDIAF